MNTAITREQFIRGFTAIRVSFGRSTAMNIAALEAGIEDYNHGQDPVAYELQTQLEERCNDTFDDPQVGTAISYGLHECGLVRPAEDAEEFRMDSAEAVWRWWEETKTGPFSPTDGLVLVPRVPTDAMLNGACRTHAPGQPMSKNHPDECPSFERRRRVWADMIEKAEGAAA